MAISRQNILEAARTYLGTPFLHQGRSRVGVDCVGLLILVAQDIGYPYIRDMEAYRRTPQPSVMYSLLAENCDEILNADAKPGDIFWMRLFGIKPRHTAFYLSDDASRERSIIHAASNGVKIEPLSNFPASWIVKTFRLRGVID